MERCEVLIVGGGPGGSSLAWRLIQSGADVLVLDKQSFPRDKTCAGWVTPPVLDALKFDSQEYARNWVFQPILGFRTGMLGGEEVETQYERPVSYGIRRCEFDHYLLKRSGARCRLGEPLRSIERDKQRWVVNEDIEARLLVGAGGHFCPVARYLGREDREGVSVVAAQEIEFESSLDQLDAGSIQPAVPELFFCDDLKGYGWCFRKGNFLNIGLGRVDPHGLSAHVTAFCDFLKDRGKVQGDIPRRFRGHAYRLYERTPPRLLDDGVLLIGDAAGLAYPQSGEGIRPAVESALMAAEVILAAQGDYSPDKLAPYGRKITDRFGNPRSRGISDWLPASWLHFLASQLMATHWFSRHVVLENWFLHVNEPVLASPLTGGR